MAEVTLSADMVEVSLGAAAFVPRVACTFPVLCIPRHRAASLAHPLSPSVVSHIALSCMTASAVLASAGSEATAEVSTVERGDGGVIMILSGGGVRVPRT